MKILFMGTPGPAKICLEALINAREEIIAIITQPDRPKGRGLKLAPSQVKETAIHYNIPVFQPDKIKDKDAIDLIRGFKPDLIVIVAYGKILPKEIIDIPKLGTINVHASMLPKYRGAAPVQRALLNGEKFTGITVMKVTEELDAGDIILQESIPIYETDNTATLTEKLFKIGAQLLVKVVSQIKSGKAKYTKQDEKMVSFAPILKKENGVIDWRKNALEIRNQIKAFNPWPVAYTYYNGKMLKIFSVDVKPLAEKNEPGAVIDIVKDKGFTIASGDGGVFLKEVQIESGKKMSAWEFLVGHKLKIGDVLPS